MNEVVSQNLDEVPGILHARKFFSTAMERYNIKIRRDNGEPWPWSKDQVFQEWRFCNVFREDDRTTTWFRENVRSHLTGMAVVRATIAFRWFNRVETAEHIKDLLLGDWDSQEAARRLEWVRPIVSGAYIIKGMDGMDKLSGVLECIDTAFSMLQHMDISTWTTLRGAWTDLKTIPYLGPFMAAEVVQDLRWTDVLENATDINTWTNAGPGCTKGLGWTVAGDRHHFRRGSHSDQAAMVEVMKQLLELSKNPVWWPKLWPEWELHTVEFWACEIWKYVRAEEGYRLKRRYRR